MIHLKKYALLLVLAVMLHTTNAQDANKTSFSLNEAIEYSLKHSLNYLNADLDLKSADYRRKEITGSGLPQINSSVDIKDYINIPTSLLPAQIFGGSAGSFIPVKFGTKYNATAGFSASQLIFSSDYIFGLKASKEFMYLSKINVTRNKAEVVAQVSKAYYTVVISKERFRVLEANIVRLKKLYDDTKALNQQGFVEAIDAERIEVQYNNLLTEKDKTEKLIGLSESLLKFQMGYNISDPIALADSLNFSGDYQELAINRIDVKQRPDYQLLQSQQSLYDLDVKRLKWGYLPSVVAYGSYQWNAQRNQFNFANDKNDPSKQWFKVALIGATLNFSIFDGLQRNYRIQQAKITSLKSQNTLHNLELAAELEASAAGTNYNNAYLSVQIQKKNLQLAQHVYDATLKKYQGGVGSNLEVVSAETTLRESQTNYLNAVYDMVTSKIDYQKAVGTLVK
jgi:outer membrane protein TolC